MTKLLDYSYARPNPNKIKSEGFDGVMRYLSYQPSKNLSAEERDNLWNAGLGIGLVWETTAQRALDGFVAGIADAEEAERQAVALGMTCPIYFAVDFQPAHPDEVGDYINGVKSILGDKAGIYGSYDVVTYFNLKWKWQTYAWSGGKKADVNIYQYSNGEWDGSVDFNEAKDNWGGQYRKENMVDDFIAKYDGQEKGYPSDNFFLGECLSIVKLYIEECYGIEPPPSGSNSAYGYWSNFPDPLGDIFEKIDNTPEGVPVKGDIMIWDTSVGDGYGHISIFVAGDTISFRSFDQNWGGKQAHIQEHNYNNVVGWLHPKGEPMPEVCFASRDMVIQTRKNLVKYYYETLKKEKKTDAKYLEEATKIADNNIDDVQFMKDHPLLSCTEKGYIKPAECPIPDLSDYIKKTECDMNLKELQDEQIQIMKEQDAAMLIADARIKELEAQLPCPKCPTCIPADADDMTVWETFALFWGKLFGTRK